MQIQVIPFARYNVNGINTENICRNAICNKCKMQYATCDMQYAICYRFNMQLFCLLFADCLKRQQFALRVIS